MNPNAVALAFSAALLLAALPMRAHAQAPGADYHGAGGPFAGAILLLPRGNAPVGLMTTGGYGYTYWLDGRLRLGGGGQGTVLSTVADGRSGSIGWGGLLLGFDPLGSGRWEFPLAVAAGGGRVSLERVRADGLIEREEATFFALQGSASVEFRPVRTVKLSLQLSWLGAIHEGLAAQALEASLRLVFLIPRPGK